MIDKIKSIISLQLGVEIEELTDDVDIEELGADSLDVVEMLAAFEDEFGIHIPDDDVVALRTFGDIAEYVETISV